MSNIAISNPSAAELAAMPLIANVQFFEPRPANAINKILTGVLPNALYEGFYVQPSAGLGVTILAAGGLALIGTTNGELIKVEGQHDVDLAVSVGANYIYLIANFLHNTITKQVDTGSAINPADLIITHEPSEVGELIAIVTVPSDETQVTKQMISYDGVNRFNLSGLAKKSELDARLIFRESLTITLYKRHVLTRDNEYKAPPATKLIGKEWFSVRASTGKPIITQANEDEATAKFKRLADGAIDTQVTIVENDRNERVFVYNKELNMWEF